LSKQFTAELEVGQFIVKQVHHKQFTVKELTASNLPHKNKVGNFTAEQIQHIQFTANNALQKKK
jgi:hypothetical protein